MNKILGQKLHHLLEQQKSITGSSQQNLPMISLNQLESKVNLSKKRKQEKQNLNEQISNSKEINVCSPFYDRMKTHKPNCKCPYHRKQRFSLVPVRHSDKSPASRINQFHRNSSHEKNDFGLNKPRNQSHLLKRSSNILNRSIPENLNHFSNTQPSGFQSKIQSHNHSYEQFLKECEYYLLKKNGFTLMKPNHVVRKGVREIFNFINKHLHYSVDKMTEWVNSVEKDKDYGDFYIERFKEMKMNSQLNRNKKLSKNTFNSSFGNFLNKSQKFNSSKSKFTNSNSSFAKLKQNRKKAQNESGQSSENQNQSKSSSQNESEDEQIDLEKIIDELKLQHRVSNKKFSNLMKMKLDSFRQLFENLQENIMNEKYKDDLLEKFNTGVLSQIMKRYSNDKTIKNLQGKLQIVTQTQEFLKKYREKKASQVDRKNSIDFSSKAFIGSKRSTQNGQNPKSSHSLHSKKMNDRCSLARDDDDYDAIEQDENEIDDDLNGQNKKSKTANHGHNVRRSKLIKGDEFDLNLLRVSKMSSNQSTDREFDIQKNGRGGNKGFLTKAEKFLFDINMGKAIVNREDSIFTAKRKIRVMKVLLKENPNLPEADQLQKYIKAIQHKVYLKTQTNKKTLKKSSSDVELPQEEVWKLISLDNLGYNLIFYNLSSKINAQDNDDLCILLNEIKLTGLKSFENNVTYKHHFDFDQNIEQQKKKHQKTRTQDIFVQEGMRNMEFEPKIQPESQKQLKSEIRTTKKIKRQKKGEISRIVQIKDPSTEFHIDEADEDQEDVQHHHYQVKKMLKYAKVHLPGTFQKYLKNTCVYSASHANSFIDQ